MHKSFEFLCGQLVFMVEKYGGASRISAQAVGWRAGLLVSTLYCSSLCLPRCNSALLKMLQCARTYLGFVFGNLYGNQSLMMQTVQHPCAQQSTDFRSGEKFCNGT
jgi:hypothetical protein